MTIFTGDDGILDDIFSYQTYNHLKNHWRAGAVPADIQDGMVWSKTVSHKLYHHAGAADEEILQLTRSSDVSPYFANLYIAEYIYHTGDLDTYVRFQPDQITLRAGGIDFINMVEAAPDYLQLLDGKNFIGDNLNTKMAVGLTINQAGYDDEILAFKSSDVAHGITDRAETDTYGFIRKSAGDEGGCDLWGLAEGNIALEFIGCATTDNTDKDATATAPVLIYVCKKVVAATGAVGADANLVVIQNAGSTRWLVDEDGDTWQGGMVTSQGLIVNTPTELTIAAGVITVTKGYHTVDGQGDAADDLVTINGGVDGMIIVLRAENDARVITVLETGNLEIKGANCLLGMTSDNITFIYDATLSKWLEISRGDVD